MSTVDLVIADKADRQTRVVKPLRLLILGGGAVVTEFYLPALQRLSWHDGITVADPSPTVIEKVKATAPWVEVRKAGFEEVLSDRKIVANSEAVVVAVPNHLHVGAVKAALHAGLPVLCEKPLALTSSDCYELSTAAGEVDLPLVVGMVRRLTPAAQAAQNAIRTGLIGQLEEVVIDHGGPYGWVSESGEFFRKQNGGILTDLGVHHLDWLEEILGPLNPVAYEDDARGGVEASCKYELRSRDSVAVHLALSYRHRRSNTTRLRGALGEITLEKDNFATCRLVRLNDGLQAELSSESPFQDDAWPRDFTSCFAQQFHNFADTVWNRAEAGTTAARASRTMSLFVWEYAKRTTVVIRDERRPELPQGKTVVTGGTGFIGTALVERLVDCGFEDLTIPVRGYRNAASVARFPVVLPKTDLTNREEVRKLVKDARWVFHLAYGQNKSEAQSITVHATKLIVEESAAAGVEAVVVLSTMYVFGHPKTSELVDESWSYAPVGGDYGKTKMQMEKWCLQNADKFGKTRVVVLNPSCVFGPEGKTYTRLPNELAERGEFAWVEQGKGTANYVYIDNLIDAMLCVANEAKASGQRFIVSDGHCSWREFLTPLLSESVDTFASYTVSELEAIEKSVKTKLRQVGSSLLKDNTLRNWFKEQSWFQPFVETTRKQLRRSGPMTANSNDTDASPALPPSWLADLFGPTSTRFSSAKLRALGWKSLVDLNTAQERTRLWLTEMGFLQ